MLKIRAINREESEFKNTHTFPTNSISLKEEIKFPLLKVRVKHV